MTGPGPAGTAGGRTVVVVGAGAANVKSTVALNLAVALAARVGADGPAVALADLDGASAAALGVAPPGEARLPWLPRALPVVDRLDAGGPEAGVLLVVDAPPRLDGTMRAALRAADVVVVPVDASALAERVLREVAAELGAGGGRRPALRVVLARRLPRDADRWGWLDRVDEAAPGALLHGTLPMAHRAGRRGRDGRRAAILYAPGTAAARAYAALADELAGPRPPLALSAAG